MSLNDCEMNMRHALDSLSAWMQTVKDQQMFLNDFQSQQAAKLPEGMRIDLTKAVAEVDELSRAMSEQIAVNLMEGLEHKLAILRTYLHD